MYKCKLTRIESTHRNLRTDVVEGETQTWPEEGKCFVMTGPGLEFGTRLVTTSQIREVRNQCRKEDRHGDPCRYVLKTEYSVYALEIWRCDAK